ncbi:MAG: lysozyme, partial [Bacteroidetes bacterium]|nr:lysozyme [Bacteroidota bacterium]
MSNKVILFSAIVLVVVFGTIGYLLMNGYISFVNPGREIFPVRGIDISHHQGEIDWGQITEPLDFVFIKATEGQNFNDTRFKDNWGNARKHGYKVGAYHFYRFCKTGIEQAH